MIADRFLRSTIHDDYDSRTTIPAMSVADSVFYDLLKRDKRYKVEAYAFVFETLEYAQTVLRLGRVHASEPLPSEAGTAAADAEPPRHVSGQDLCLAARDYAQRQYGRLAVMVLDSMGIRTTGDIGEIVYNLISIEHMRKTAEDRREDFDDVFDFRRAFDETYQITD